MARHWPVWVVVILGLLFTDTSVSRAGMDYDLADAGSSRPFSQLLDAIPTAWTLLSPAQVPGPTIGDSPAAWLTRPSDLAEPALGNPNDVMLGQIVSIGSLAGADRGVWGVYDRLAVIPIPILLYFDDFHRLTEPVADTLLGAGDRPLHFGPGDFSGSGSSGNNSSSVGSLSFTDIVPVPEPGCIALLLPAAALLLRRH